MTNLQKKLATALATGAVLANAFVPAAFASTDLIISGNGSSSDSTVNVQNNNSTTVSQNNNADVTNNVNVSANTGKNSANDNTGGDVNLNTGAANTNVTVDNALNNNVASVNNCGCSGDTTVTVSGNGTGSDNNVKLSNGGNTTLSQNNTANVKNNVDVDANSGKNYANDNTGGDVNVQTGDVNTDVSLSTVANANSARIGGSSDNAGGTVSAYILGNGSYSDNNIKLDLGGDATLSQNNNSNIRNDVDVDANSGKNDVNDNTGGDDTLVTGDINSTVAVDNMVNFNAADIADCSCASDLTAKIAGNGTESDNRIKFDNGGDNTVAQNNSNHLHNDFDVNGDSGKNDVNGNTGAVDFVNEPGVSTGDAGADVSVSNTGGYNAYGNVDLTFNMGDLMNWFNSLVH